MSKLYFAVNFETEVDTGEIHAVYFRVRKGKVHETRELVEGSAFADYNRHGELLGIELLGPCRVTALDRLIQTEPDNVRRFVKRSIPRHLARA